MFEILIAAVKGQVRSVGYIVKRHWLFGNKAEDFGNTNAQVVLTVAWGAYAVNRRN